MVKKVQMNLDENLVSRIDRYAKMMGITRTDALSVLVSYALLGVKCYELSEMPKGFQQSR